MSNLIVIRSVLQNIIDQIDKGKCGLSDEEIKILIDLIRRYANPEQKLSKAQVCLRLGISRATFDNYVRAGIFPKGQSQVGFKEKFWTNSDISNKI